MLKNITFSAEEMLVQKARERAMKEKKTLNEIFRDWLSRYVGQESNAKEYDRLMKKMNYVRAGRKFTREEMNER